MKGGQSARWFKLGKQHGRRGRPVCARYASSIDAPSSACSHHQKTQTSVRVVRRGPGKSSGQRQVNLGPSGIMCGSNREGGSKGCRDALRWTSLCTSSSEPARRCRSANDPEPQGKGPSGALEWGVGYCLAPDGASRPTPAEGVGGKQRGDEGGVRLRGGLGQIAEEGAKKLHGKRRRTRRGRLRPGSDPRGGCTCSSGVACSILRFWVRIQDFLLILSCLRARKAPYRSGPVMMCDSFRAPVPGSLADRGCGE